MELTGAEIILECLKEQGVDTIFGYPGGAILNVYDALYRYQDQITHVLTSHEQGAAHAADGYARIKGYGAIITTFGVGELSAINAVAGSMAENVPVIKIVGTPSSNFIKFEDILDKEK